MADYTQPDYVEKRLRYFDGQLLKDQDFVDEQKYFIDRQRRYNRFLNVAGIIHGLTLTTASDLVTVAPGAALDNRGRLVVLSDQVIETERQAPLRDYRGQTVDLVISYKEDPDPPTGNAPRFREKPLLTVVRSGQPTPADAIALARLTIDNAGVVTVDTNVRIYAGLRLPYDGAAPGTGPALRAGSTNRMDLTGGLSVSGNVGIGTTGPNAKLQVDNPNAAASQALILSNSNSGYAAGEGVYQSYYVGGTTGNEMARIQAANKTATIGSHGYLAFYTRNADQLTEKVRIDNTGNVGIGTTDPETYKLKVEGTLNVTGASTLTGNVGIGTSSALSFGNQVRQMVNLWSTGYGIGVQNGTQYFRTDKNFAWYKGGAHNDAELNAGANGTIQMVIKDGNVGVGTSDPKGFQVALPESSKGSAAPGPGVTIAGGPQGNASIELRNNGSGTPFIDFAQAGTTTDYDARIRLTAPGQLAIEGAKVGVGIASPDKHLHIEGGELRVRASHNNTTSDIGAFYAQNLTQGIGIGYNRIEAIGSNANQDILLMPKGTGNVGIGTPSPGAKLEVAGGAIMPAAGNSETAGIMFPKNPGGGSGDAAWIRYYAREGEKTTFEIGTSNDVDDHIALMASGNVGIGTTTPGEKLDVNGSVKATKFIGEGAFVRGMIVMWSGALTQVPTGWALCDGLNGTPDLRRRFIVGAASGAGQYGIGETGGLDNVTLSVAQMPSHNHNNGEWKWLLLVNGNNTTNSIDRSATEPNLVTPAEILPAGGNQPHENRPPYYALAYIMKL